MTITHRFPTGAPREPLKFFCSIKIMFFEIANINATKKFFLKKRLGTTAITLYMTCNTFVCTIIFGQLELSIIISIELSNELSIELSVTLTLLIFNIKSLNQVFLGDSDIQNMIVQMNVLHKYLTPKSCMRFTPGYISYIKALWY